VIEHRGKLEEIAQAIEAERGPFALFGLFRREQSSGKWDLVVSAPWLEKGKLIALGEFVQTLAKEIGEDAVLSFSRIVTLNHDEPPLSAILEEVGTAPLPVEKQGRDLFGLPIEYAYILRANANSVRRNSRTQLMNRPRRSRSAARH